jgi:hypothetical protein
MESTVHSDVSSMVSTNSVRVIVGCLLRDEDLGGGGGGAAIFLLSFLAEAESRGCRRQG